ncbi:hypothetical protein IFM89_003600 [Coptis chinensis]|uniref:proline--tRNA ligase n=1 Tax=Coptis chinensis TaxID=261450 RepID=A0A835HZZ6_9MAGN|nr:hypothetical protein IFM89_003600 [Coptis chinensis]
MADNNEKKSKPVTNDKEKKSGGCGKKKQVKKETGLALTHKKDENFGEWYSEVVVSSEMIEYYDISGCYILRPWTMSIWEVMQTFFDAEIKKMKIKNCYFPVFVSESCLQKEKDHIDGFAAEVAWVTRSGKTELDLPIAIRPTSETVMYPYFSKWIRGHRDLPLRLNQWCNVVRWEFSNPTPFIRSREFLWQEGHTAFATKEEADKEVLEILELYRRVYEEFLAVPVVKGKKSEKEKFAGGLYTTSVEAFVPNTGRGVQGATSHCLGQNFAKMFDIQYENEKGGRGMVWQNSWAYSTRTIGVMVMVHGDDKGLVLPPKVASVQVIVVPVPYKDADMQAIFDACSTTVKILTEAGFRVEEDLRENYSPGWKYSHWEMKGVPLRIEIGPKDIANKQVRVVRRDNSSKMDISTGDLAEKIGDILENIQQSLFDAAKEKRDACIKVATAWEEFTTALNEKKLILAPWCDEKEVEKEVKAKTMGENGACKTLCTPFYSARTSRRNPMLCLREACKGVVILGEELLVPPQNVIPVSDFWPFVVYKDFLAIPVVKGKKSELEKFAGICPKYWAWGTRCNLPIVLVRILPRCLTYNIENEKGGRDMAWQNSWANSTHTIGVMVMVHGDDKGLVLPPKVASGQVIVVPVPGKSSQQLLMRKN